MGIIILAVGMAGIALVVFFAMRAYLPIYHLNRILRNVPAQPGEGRAENELVHIRSVFQRILRENQRITGLMQDNIRYMQERFLAILLNGDVGSGIYENLEDLLSALQLNLPGPHYTVFCLYLAEGVPYHIKDEISKLIRQSLVWHPGAAYPVNIASYASIPIVVSLGPRISGEEKGREEFAGALHGLLALHSIEGTVFGGGVYGDLRNIDKACIEALAVQDRYGSIPGKTLLFSPLSDGGKLNHEEEFQAALSLLVQGIKKGNEESALKSMEAIFTLIKAAPYTAAMRRYKIFRLLGDMADIFCQIGFWDKSSVDENLEVLFSSAALKEKIAALVSGCCEFVKSGGKTRCPDTRLGTVREYLDANFSDPALSLDQVADIFGMSPFHLSRDFKKTFKVNFVDYISFLRINKAKHLLADTNIKIKDIVGELGYHDVPNFIRKFRLIEGITPGQYRTALEIASPPNRNM
jgi:AraC-like DNA-binding protein